MVKATTVHPLHIVYFIGLLQVIYFLNDCLIIWISTKLNHSSAAHRYLIRRPCGHGHSQLRMKLCTYFTCSSWEPDRVYCDKKCVTEETFISMMKCPHYCFIMMQKLHLLHKCYTLSQISPYYSTLIKCMRLISIFGVFPVNRNTYADIDTNPAVQNVNCRDVLLCWEIEEIFCLEV